MQDLANGFELGVLRSQAQNIRVQTILGSGQIRGDLTIKKMNLYSTSNIYGFRYKNSPTYGTYLGTYFSCLYNEENFSSDQISKTGA